MKNYLKNKKGSTSVLLTALFASLVLVVGMFAEASSGKATRSFAQGVFDTAARSVLSEYDRTLKKDYGLFAFYGEKETLETKMKAYADVSSDKKNQRDKIDLLRWKTQDVTVDTSGYSLTDVNVLEDEIYEYMKYHISQQLLEQLYNDNHHFALTWKSDESSAKDVKKNVEQLKEELEEQEGNGEEDENAAQVKEGKKKLEGIKAFGEDAVESTTNDGAKNHIVLRNKGILSTLPSQTLDKPRGIKPGSLKTVAVNEYIINVFRNHLDSQEPRERFFQNEIEYILSGGWSDDANYKKVKVELIAMRTALNIAHIYADLVKRNETLTLATSLTPGPWVPFTQFVIITAWAGAEAANDIKLLETGKMVPFIKDNASWALSLSGVVNGKNEQTQKLGEKGLDYEGYLRILLYVKNRDEKLIRIMDLIQINLKGTCNDMFQLQEYCVGFKYGAHIGKVSGFFGIMGSSTRKAELQGVFHY